MIVETELNIEHFSEYYRMLLYNNILTNQILFTWIRKYIEMSDIYEDYIS